MEENKNKKRKRWEDEMELSSYEKKIKDQRTKVEPEVIVFNGRPKKVPLEGDIKVSSEGTPRLQDLSHEVYQLGISGFEYGDKEKIEMQRAIKLGAKPPKNAYIPYKEFMKQQKDRRKEELKQREIDRKSGLKVRKRSAHSNSKKSPHLRKTGFWQDPSKDKKFRVDGQIGRYKQGIQVLSKQDIHRIKGGKQRVKSKGKRQKSR